MTKKFFNFAVIGNDLRQKYIAEYLENKEYNVITLNGIEDDNSIEYIIKNSDNIILPILVSRDGVNLNIEDNRILLSSILENLQAKQKVFGGCISSDMKNFCDKKNVFCYDFMKNESLAIYNAIATAEGAIVEALIHQTINIHGSKSLVLGYGKCGSVLADKLKGLSSVVTICARNEKARSIAESLGYNSIDFDKLKTDIKSFDYIFNTVPAKVLDRELLCNIKNDAIIIDIASVPGGVDYNYAKKINLKAYLCLGLPGKYSPKSSGYKLAKIILNNI